LQQDKGLRLADCRYEGIKKEVYSLFVDADYHMLPIDGKEIAESMNYRLIAYSELSARAYAASLDVSNDAYCTIGTRDDGLNEYDIYYNDAARPERINFSLLHEIGHIYLGHLDENKKEPAVAEAEANFFAKYAIAPPPLINELRCQNAEALRSYFLLSRECAAYAYEYYIKWFNCRPEYNDFEHQLIQQFESSLRQDTFRYRPTPVSYGFVAEEILPFC
jgi:Zn-dependent peptidase ImmA (M78 family)